jgi:pheromone alpha factor receptor
MMESFDPYAQVFTLIGPDGRTRIPASMAALNWYYYNNIRLAISFAGQLSVAGLMILIVVFMTEKPQLMRPSTLLNMIGLAACLVSRLLLVLYYTGPFSNIYSVFTNDYSAVTRGDYGMSIASTTVGTILILAVELTLMYQAWTLLQTWPQLPKWSAVIVSLILVLSVLGFRFASMVFQNISVLNLSLPKDTVWILKTSVILSSVSIFWFCALFNIRLVSHFITARSILPPRATLSPMEILVIVNGILMIIPGQLDSDFLKINHL